MTKADITRRVIPPDNDSIYDAQIVSIGVCGKSGVCQTERNCLRPRGMQIVSIGACTSPTEVIILVFSPLHMFSPMTTISLEFGHIQKGGTPTNLPWLPSQGDPVKEPVGLWVQPDSVRAGIMTICILAGSIHNTVLDEVLKLRPDIKTNTWSCLVGKLTDGAEKHICRQVVKSKRVPENFSIISSKSSLLDAMLATIAKVSDRRMLTEWSAACVNAKSELRSIWSAFYKKILVNPMLSQKLQINPQT